MRSSTMCFFTNNFYNLFIYVYYEYVSFSKKNRTKIHEKVIFHYGNWLERKFRTAFTLQTLQ